VRILLVEDDPFDALEMSHMLRHAAATVDITGTGAAACALAGRHDYDLVLLDLAPPDMEGHEVLRRLRAAHIDTPVVMLPGHSLPAEKIRALGFGADRARPYDPSALAVGIQAAAHPGSVAPQSPLTAGHVTLNPMDRVATVRGRPVRLTAKEYEVLELLMRRKGSVLTKAAFLDHLYGGAEGPEVKIIDVFICKLRRKLCQAGAGDLIGTVWGRGYVLRDPRDPARCAAPCRRPAGARRLISTPA
jgi:two-component system cell cycle response regulator CtrA